MVELYLLYKELLVTGKIHYKSKILNVIYSKSNIVTDDHIIKNYELIKDLNLDIKCVNVNDYSLEEKYDLIIFQDIFECSKYATVIDNFKKLLKDPGLYMFVFTIVHNYVICNIFNYLNYKVNINYYLNIDDIFNMIPISELKVIDNYRLYTEHNFITTNEVFVITCKNRYY